jgi:hypothetical protein
MKIDDAFKKYQSSFIYLMGIHLKGLVLFIEKNNLDWTTSPNKEIHFKYFYEEYLESIRKQCELYLDGLEMLLVPHYKDGCWWELNINEESLEKRCLLYRRADAVVGGMLNLKNLTVVRLISCLNSPDELCLSSLKDAQNKLINNKIKLTLSANNSNLTVEGTKNNIVRKFIHPERTMKYLVIRFSFKDIPVGRWELSNHLPEYDITLPEIDRGGKLCGSTLLPFALSFDVTEKKDDENNIIGDYKSLPLCAYGPSEMWTLDGRFNRIGFLHCDNYNIRSHNKGYVSSDVMSSFGYLGFENKPTPFNLPDEDTNGNPWDYSRFYLYSGISKIRYDVDSCRLCRYTLYEQGVKEARFNIHDIMSVAYNLCDMKRFPVGVGDWVRIRCENTNRLLREESGKHLIADGYLDAELTKSWYWFRFEK